jgi:hypothetical protein
MPVALHVCTPRCQTVNGAIAHLNTPAAPYGAAYVQPGDTVWASMPWSEVMMFMGLAGRTIACQLRDTGHPMVQLLTDTGGNWSAPVLTGEAGFHRNNDGWYYYPPLAP